MQSSLLENVNTKHSQKAAKESSSGTTITNSTEGSTNSDIIKKKRKRNRKKNKSNQVIQKVENLISKTFQAKVEAENNKIKLSDEKCENLLNMNSEINPKISKTSQSAKKSSLSTKNSPLPTKNTISQTKQTPKKSDSPAKSSSSSNSSPINKQEGKIIPAKSREEVLAERDPKKLNKQSAKNKNESCVITANAVPATKTALSSAPELITQKTDKSREEILAEREAKKLAKQLGKNKNQIEKPASNAPPVSASAAQNTEKTREEILAEREAKKLAKKGKANNDIDSVDCVVRTVQSDEVKTITNNMKNIQITEIPEKKQLSKAERRAIQEAQRAAKAQFLAEKQMPKKTADIAKPVGAEKKLSPVGKDIKIGDAKNLEKAQNITKNLSNECKVKLFNHLDCNMKEKNLFINNPNIHPAMVRLGEQFFKRTIVGSNARCVAFLSALKMVIQDYETPPKKEFSRGLESIIKNCVDHLHKCRPLAVSISNAHKHIKLVLTQLGTDQPESELKEYLCEVIDTYIKDQIEKAALAISSSVQEKISNGDVILTFGCSSLINHILEEAHSRKIDFRVIVVDSRPFSEGQELLRRLVTKEIPCTYVLINAVGFIMPEVTKVLLGAHSLLANGYVMARTGTAQVALVARSFNVPVLVCCETHKFSERVQTDAIVYNELGNPHDLIISQQCKLFNWPNSNHKLSPLNINFDITPPELVTAVVTEVAILPCTSVPVILRLKPTEIGY